MHDRVANSTASTDGTLPADSRLEGVRLGAVENLNVVEDDLTLAPSTITFEVVSREDLTTPTVSVFSLDLDVPRQKDHLSTHINSIVRVLSRGTSTPMVLVEGFVEDDSATRDLSNSPVL